MVSFSPVACSAFSMASSARERACSKRPMSSRRREPYSRLSALRRRAMNVSSVSSETRIMRAPAPAVTFLDISAPAAKSSTLGGHGLAQGLFINGKGAHGLLDGDARVQTALCQRHHAEIVGGEKLFAAPRARETRAPLSVSRAICFAVSPLRRAALRKRHALARVRRVGFVGWRRASRDPPVPRARGLHQPLDDGKRIIALALQSADRANGVDTGAVVIGPCSARSCAPGGSGPPWRKT